MLLSDLSVKRPVLATVINLLLITFGIVAFLFLPLREYPDIDPPIVSINTSYPGASAEIVESKITQVLEDRISGIEGIRNVSSSSRNGRSSISIEFDLSRDIDSASNDVRERISRALNELPDQAQPPEVFKANDDEDVIVWFVINSDGMSSLELTDYAQRFIVDRFAVLDGVARVRLGGERTYAMKIELDRAAMAARNITVSDIESALLRENVELPAGEVESVQRDFNVRVMRSYLTVEDFRRLVVSRGDDGYLVRLAEIAQVDLGSENDKTLFRGNGKNMVGLGIIKQSKANTLAVADRAKAEMKRLSETLPDGIYIQQSYDSSIFIADSIKEVYRTLFIAMLMVIVVIFLFLGNLRATIIPALTVPVALIASFTVMYAMGFSINLLTLLALVLSIGLVVDDSIVVLENIHRRIEGGEPPLLASYKGARQVAFAVIATTLVLISVFVPLIFLEGDIGRLFTEFAIAISAAVAFSSITALTLTPMLCSKLIRHEPEKARLSGWIDRKFKKLEHFYRNSLEHSLTHPMAAAAILLLSVLLIIGLFSRVDQEFSPKEDRGNFFISMQSAEGASYQSNADNMHKIEAILTPYLEDGTFNRLIVRVPGFGGGGGIAIIGMADWDQRERSTWDVMDEINDKVAAVPDVRAFSIMRRGLGGRGLGRPVQFVIGGNTYDELARYRDIIFEAAAENPGLTRLDSDYKETLPQILVQIDRNRASDLGVSVSTIGRTLETMLGQRRVTTYINNGEEYNVVLEGIESDYQSPSSLNSIYVRSDVSGELIPLSNLVTLNEQATAGTLNRYNRFRAITISADLVEDYPLSDALDFLATVVRDQLPADVNIDYKGQSQSYQEAGSSIIWIFLLALAITFLVLAAQFESFIHPLVIILTVPLALAGALLGLYFTDLSINIYSQIGMIMLIGLAAKNGILIVEFANQLRDQGLAFIDALLEASRKRLRPIVMTAFTTVMSAIPLVLATGPGAESRMVIGVVILSGVLFSAVLTLFVVPSTYYWLARNTSSPKHLARTLKRLNKQYADPDQQQTRADQPSVTTPR